MALFDRFRQWRQQRLSRQEQATRFDRHIDTVIDAVDPRLRMLTGYRRRLGPALHHAIEVIDELAATLPPPLEITRAQWSRDPFLRACFTSPVAMQKLFDGHKTLHRFLSSDLARDATTVYAGLGMSLKVTQRFGHALQGDMVQRDVAQQVVTLGDYRLSAFAPSSEALLAGVRERVLQDLAMRSTQAAFSARTRKESLTEERTKVMMRLRLYEQQAEGLDTFWHEEEVIDRHAVELRQKLAEMEGELDQLQASAADLDDFLDMTVEVFGAIDRDLRLEQRTFHLDDSNIHHDGPGQGIAEVPMTLVHVAQRPPRVFRLVRFAADFPEVTGGGGLKEAERALGVH